MKNIRININSLHKHLKTVVKNKIFNKYKNQKIFSEADLQSYLCRLLEAYVKKDERKNYFQVLNKPYIKEFGLYPDLVIFRRREPKSIPWVVFELKEVKQLKEPIAVRERKYLRKFRTIGCKRTYLLYIALYGPRRVLPTIKGEDSRYFFEFPIILKRELLKRNSRISVEDWVKHFRYLAKYKRK